MKQIKTIFMLVLLSAVLFSCSNARYGHLKKVKKNEKATVQKHERENKPVQPAEQIIEEIAAVEAAATINETVVAENAATENASVAASPTTTNTNKNNTVSITNTIESTKEAVKNNIKESKKAIGPVKKKRSSGKSQIIALILVLLVGTLGIHRFYLGYTWQGIVQLLTLGLCGIWTLIDLIRIITGDLQPKDGEYDETL